MKSTTLFFSLLVVGLISSCDSNDDTPAPPLSQSTYTPTEALKQKASYPIGLATQARYLDDNAYTGILDQEFNSLSAEYEMKQQTTHTGEDQYNWEPVDKIVNYAEARSYRVHGHALIWHLSIPTWLENFAGTDEEFENVIKNYIQETVRRYQGKVASWDVVNEALEEDGTMRNTLFSQRMGPDYVAKCFQYAREADPGVLLFYNDYGTIWSADKLQGQLSLIDDLKARGIPLDGVGLQMHVSYNWPSLSDIKRAVDLIQSRGLRIHFSELDIRANPDKDLTELTLERAVAQKDRIKEVIDLFNTIPVNQQFGITMWGLRDHESWLLDFYGPPDWPLLIDRDNQYKLVHQGFIEAL